MKTAEQRTWLESIIDWQAGWPSGVKLAFCLAFFGFMLWGVVTEKPWALRWTNTAKMQFLIDLLGYRAFRLLNIVLWAIAMLGVTYLFLR